MPFIRLSLPQIPLRQYHDLMWIRQSLALLVLILLPCTSGAQNDVAMDVLDMLAEESYNVSVAVYPVDDPESGYFHNERAMRPLASTIKILVLAEYTRRVEEGVLDPDQTVPLDSIEAFYFPNTDGGAHLSAMAALEEAGALEDSLLTLNQVAGSMIRFSDNAATDYLIMRFGREAMEALPGRVGTQFSEPPAPFSGLFLALDLPREFGEDPSWYEGTLIDRAWRFADRLKNSWKFVDDMNVWMESFSERMTYYDLSAAVLEFPAGSAGAYAEIMAKLFYGELISEAVSVRMLSFLDWPMDNPQMSSTFSQFATKGGALPSILTSTYLVEESGAESPMVLSLLVEGLSEDIWLDWLTTFKHQQFELRLLTDSAFRFVAIERFREK